MTVGLTGNPLKDTLWAPAAALVDWLRAERRPFWLHDRLAEGLAARGLLPAADAAALATPDLAGRADVVLSFGGDGTLLRVAHDLGSSGTPLLGINIGRLGFLADIETQEAAEAVRRLAEGRYAVEPRLALALDHDGAPFDPPWALNEFVFERSGRAGLVAVEVAADGVPLGTYWGDGLIVATPTGSTAYALSVGGPIVAPTAGVLVLAPVAPHTLTLRPIVLPDAVTLTLRVRSQGAPFVVAADGTSREVEAPGGTFTLRRAAHAVPLVRLDGQDFFGTLREKLMWGAGVKGGE